MIRIEECILYRDFAEGEVLRDMTDTGGDLQKTGQRSDFLKGPPVRENMSAYEPQFLRGN